MTKDFEPNDFQSNKLESSNETDQPSNASAEDTIEIKIGDQLLPKESYVDKPKTQMSAKQQFEEEVSAPAKSEPKTRIQRRQMEVRESLLANSSKIDEEQASITAETGNVTTREEKRKAEMEEGKSNRKQKRQLKVRLIPVWLRILIILLLALIAVVAGTMIGYGVLGKGNPLDVFNRDTWTHIRDIVMKK